jgi:hypothetical protein
MNTRPCPPLSTSMNCLRPTTQTKIPFISPRIYRCRAPKGSECTYPPLPPPLLLPLPPPPSLSPSLHHHRHRGALARFSYQTLTTRPPPTTPQLLPRLCIRLVTSTFACTNQQAMQQPQQRRREVAALCLLAVVVCLSVMSAFDICTTRTSTRHLQRRRRSCTKGYRILLDLRTLRRQRTRSKR